MAFTHGMMAGNTKENFLKTNNMVKALISMKMALLILAVGKRANNMETVLKSQWITNRNMGNGKMDRI